MKLQTKQVKNAVDVFFVRLLLVPKFSFTSTYENEITYSQYSTLAETFAALAIAVGVVETLDMFAIIVGKTVALPKVAFTPVLFAMVLFTLSPVLLVAVVNSTQFAVFHSFPQVDQGRTEVKDANM